MTSTKEERVTLTYDAYSRAHRRRGADLKKARTEQEVMAVLANVARLESTYLAAAQDGLDGNNAAIEAAYADARAATEAVEQAYAEAKALAEKIRLVGALAGKVGTLVDAAAGPDN